MEQLIKQLYNWRNKPRPKIVKALGETGDTRAVEYLIEALERGSWRARKYAAEALGDLGGPEAVQPLIAALRDMFTSVRVMASEALVKIGFAAAEPLIKELKDSSPVIRKEAAAAMGTLGDKRAAEALLDLIQDKDDAWENATLALAKIGDTRATEFLIEAASWQVPGAEQLLEQFSFTLPTSNRNFFCESCLLKAERFTSRYTLILSNIPTFHYYACRRCRSNLYLIEGIAMVVLVLDRQFDEVSARLGSTLLVNGIKEEKIPDYDEIHIENADDFDVERLLMKLKNDMDKKRRKRMPQIPVYLSPGLELSPGKMNMLKDNLKVSGR
jgi:hypothetical protein